MCDYIFIKYGVLQIMMTEGMFHLTKARALGLLMAVTIFSVVFISTPGKHIDANISEVAKQEFILQISKTETLTAIEDLFQVTGLKELKGNYFNLGSSQHAVIRIETTNIHNQPSLDKWVYLTRNNVFTPIYLVLIRGNRVTHQQMEEVTLDKKLLRVKFPQIIEETQIFITLEGKYLRGHIDITDEKVALEKLKSTSARSGMYYGVAGLIVFSCFLLAALTKSVTYGSYGLLLFVTALWIGAGEGWLRSLLPEFIGSPFIVVNSLGLLFFFSFALFSKHYLQLSIISKSLNQVLHFGQLYMGIIWILFCAFFEKIPDGLYQFFYAITLIVGITILFASVWGAVISYRRKRVQAVFYLLATVVLACVGLLLVLSISANINFPFNWHLVQFTSVLEIMLLSMGFVFWYKQQSEELARIESELKLKEVELREVNLSVTELKENMNANLVPSTLTPHIARVVSLLSHIVFIKGSGNFSEAHYLKGNNIKEELLDCNLQDIVASLGAEHILRCHKSYLVNPLKNYKLKRRSSADFDLILNEEKIPVGRKYQNEVKRKFSV